MPNPRAPVRSAYFNISECIQAFSKRVERGRLTAYPEMLLVLESAGPSAYRYIVITNASVHLSDPDAGCGKRVILRGTTFGDRSEGVKTARGETSLRRALR